MNIRLLKAGEQPPWKLLLLADPSKNLVSRYLDKGFCYVMASDYGETIGVIVLVPIGNHIIEIMNLAVDVSHQGKGLGTLLLKHGIQTAPRMDMIRLKSVQGIQALINWLSIKKSALELLESSMIFL